MILAGGFAALARDEAFASHATELRRLAAEADTMAAEAGTVTGQGVTTMPGEISLATMRRFAERAAELYLDAAETTRDEQALPRLQSLASRAIARISRLGAMEGGG